MFAADRRLQDKDCYENNCALCHFPTRMNLSIRGLCSSDTKVSEGYFDRFYFIQGYISDNPHWRGFGKSHIYYRPRRQVWRLESFYDLERYAEFFADDSNPYSKFENNILHVQYTCTLYMLCAELLRTFPFHILMIKNNLAQN